MNNTLASIIKIALTAISSMVGLVIKLLSDKVDDSIDNKED